jgi:hypothetical protein
LLERLFEAWQRRPRERLCQLMSNTFGTDDARQLFHVEDSEFIEAIEKYVGLSREGKKSA